MNQRTIARLDAIAQELTAILSENTSLRGSYEWESLYNARLAVEQVSVLLAPAGRERADG